MSAASNPAGFTLAFAFDLDGVLVNSNPIHVETWKRFLAGFGISYTTEMAHAMFGRHNDELIQEYFGHHLTAEEIRRLGHEKEKLYRQLLASWNQDFLVPGVLEFLQWLQGYPLAVASNAEAENVRFILQHSGLQPFFQVVVFADQGLRPKPAPDIYLQVARALDVPPCQLIVFEDSPTGVAAAKAAGARTVGVLTTFPSLEGVDLAIRDFRDPAIYRWVQQLQASSEAVRTK